MLWIINVILIILYAWLTVHAYKKQQQKINLKVFKTGVIRNYLLFFLLNSIIQKKVCYIYVSDFFVKNQD